MGIKLYYYKTGNNFGDILSKNIVEALSGELVKWEKPYRADLIAVGSLFDKVQESRFKRKICSPFKKINVWGTGVHTKGKKLSCNGLDIHAVRGKITADRLGLSVKECVLGDPAILCSKLFELNDPSGREKSVIATPHKNDINSKLWVDKISKLFQVEVETVHLCQDPNVILDKIAKAKCVITSAMHPLIVGHSYGVPVVLVNVGQAVVPGGEYKFRDYFSAIDMPCRWVDLNDILANKLSKTEVEDYFDSSIVSKQKIDDVCMQLINCFPYKIAGDCRLF